MITSTGSLPQSLSKEEFLAGVSAPRNKEIMRIFKDVKLVEHLGSGVKRILEVYNQSVFNISQNFIRVTFMFDKELVNVGKNVGVNVGANVGVKDFKLSKNQERILVEIEKNNYITQKELALLLNITDRTVQRNTAILQEQGLLKRVGPAKSGYWELIK